MSGRLKYISGAPLGGAMFGTPRGGLVLLTVALCTVGLVVVSSVALSMTSPDHGSLPGQGLNPLGGLIPGPSTKYSITFSESGLPNGSCWSVALSNGDRGSVCGSSSNVTVGFLEPNGTYSFSVSPSYGGFRGGALYPTPATGTVTVNGAAVLVPIAFAGAPLETITFTETGLPSGSPWQVSLVEVGGGFNGSAAAVAPDCYQYFNQSNNSSIAFQVPAGFYSYSVGSGGNGSTVYLATPSSGIVNATHGNASVAVAFEPVVYYTVTFTETGLPSGTFWFVALNGANRSGGFPVFGGANALGAATPSCYPIGNGSTNSSIAFELLDGTYGFSVGNVSNNSTVYVPAPANGTVTVNGTNLTVPISFSRVVLYNLTFTETGLANGTFWSVGVSGNESGFLWNGTTNSSVSFLLPNGTYNFTVYNATNCSETLLPSPTTGIVTMSGANVTVPVAFQRELTYTVSFVEAGLPTGTTWSVVLFGAAVGFEFNASNNSTVNLTVLNGSYGFRVGPASNCTTLYLPTPEHGNVTVDGGNVTVAVSFARLTLYTVTFHETGLPNGTPWFVEFAGGDGFGAARSVSSGTNVSFTVPNGTYPFEIPEAGYHHFESTSVGPDCVGTNNSSGSLFVATPSYGNVTVDGSDVVVNVTFSTPTLYSVTFTETGLPQNLTWGVALGNPGVGVEVALSNASSLQFSLPNGTYAFHVGSLGNFTPGGYTATPSTGNVTVNGSAVTVSVTFAPGAPVHAGATPQPGVRSGSGSWVTGPLLLVLAAVSAVSALGALVVLRRL